MSPHSGRLGDWRRGPGTVTSAHGGGVSQQGCGAITLANSRWGDVAWAGAVPRYRARGHMRTGQERPGGKCAAPPRTAPSMFVGSMGLAGP